MGTNDIYILVVDDEPAVVDLVSTTLQAIGYRVVTASNGNEALDALNSQMVDLIITDIAMSGMNGYQLLERVRQNSDWAAIPVFFLTGRSMDSDVAYGKALGVEGYLTKPLDSRNLTASIKGALLRAQQLSRLRHNVAPSPPSSPLPVAVEVQTHGRLQTYGRLQIDLDQRLVLLDGDELLLSVKQFDFLCCLVEHPQTAVSAEELIYSTHKLKLARPEASSLARPIARRLRRRLGIPTDESGWIQTVRGFGYRLLPPP